MPVGGSSPRPQFGPFGCQSYELRHQPGTALVLRRHPRKRKPPWASRGFRGGRYWARTSGPPARRAVRVPFRGARPCSTRAPRRLEWDVCGRNELPSYLGDRRSWWCADACMPLERWWDAATLCWRPGSPGKALQSSLGACPAFAGRFGQRAGGVVSVGGTASAVFRPPVGAVAGSSKANVLPGWPGSQVIQPPSARASSRAM